MINPNAYNQGCSVPCQDRRAAYAPRTRTTSLGHTPSVVAATKIDRVPTSHTKSVLPLRPRS